MPMGMPAVQAACNPERSRGRRGADDRPGNEDDVVHENGRLAVVGEDTFGSLGEEERERRHSLEYAGREHRRRHHGPAAEGAGGRVHDRRERSFGVHR